MIRDLTARLAVAGAISLAAIVMLFHSLAKNQRYTMHTYISQLIMISRTKGAVIIKDLGRDELDQA